MIEVFNIEQGSPDWFQCRSMIPTASMFKDATAKGEGKTRRTYMLKLIGERITGVPSEGFSNSHTERGTLLEPEARDAYAFIKDADPELVGFVRNDGIVSAGPIGASPDSLIGTDGCLEIKTKLPHLQCEVLLADKVPPEHVKQVQGVIWVCEREWCDFVSYYPGMPVFIKRAYRDEKVIAELKSGLESFYEEMLELEHRIKSMA